jgi:hypothetical protein
MLNKICTWTAKTRTIPSPPERLTSFSRAGLYRDSFPARTTEVVQSGRLAIVPSRVLGTARCLRRVTQPPFIAGLLGLIYGLSFPNKGLYLITLTVKSITNETF